MFGMATSDDVDLLRGEVELLRDSIAQLSALHDPLLENLRTQQPQPETLAENPLLVSVAASAASAAAGAAGASAASAAAGAAGAAGAGAPPPQTDVQRQMPSAHTLQPPARSCATVAPGITWCDHSTQELTAAAWEVTPAQLPQLMREGGFCLSFGHGVSVGGASTPTDPPSPSHAQHFLCFDPTAPPAVEDMTSVGSALTNALE